MINHFNRMIRCVKCNQAIPVTSLNLAPHYNGEGDIVGASQDDVAEFLEPHRDHPRDGLTIQEGSYLSDSPYREPMAKGVFEAKGEDNRCYIVTVQREDITCPRRYTTERGWIRKGIDEAVFQKKEIELQIEADLNGSNLMNKERIVDFMDCLHLLSEARGVYSEENSRATDHPLVNEVKLSSTSVSKLKHMFGTLAHPKELDFIKSFIEEHIEGVLRVIVKHEIYLHKVQPV